jgi:thymidylate synthase ThyX
MEIEILRFPTDVDWARCLFLARVTQGKDGMITPSEEWKRKIISAEHSPIRTLMYTIAMWQIPYFASVHFVRHKFGVEHYVKSQRVNPNRGEDRQDSPVNHVMDLNAQALINISRKRLCYKADPKTREIMEEIASKIFKVDPVMHDFMVPDCVYRGACHEFQSCGYFEKRTQ